MSTHTAFVLAAGFGTRLRPLTELRPKPLVPVCGVPMLAYALALCARHGHRRVVVNAHYLADQLRPWAGEHEGVEVTLSVEAPDILGTGGGLAAVRDQLAERFAIVNADILCDIDLTALVDAVPAGGAAMALRPTDDVDEYGLVAADTSGTVVQLTSVAQAPAQGEVRRDTHFTGVHALHRDALARVPVAFSSIISDSYAHTVPQRRVRGLRHTGTWLDVGNPAAYLAANLAVLAGQVALPLDPFARAAFGRSGARVVGEVPPGVVVRGNVWVGEGAELGAGVVLEDCVIGAGAVVPAGATVRRSVVWDGVTVGEEGLDGQILPATAAVVTP